MRLLLLSIGLGVLALSPAFAAGRVIILGFDGVEPSIVQTMLEAGELPALDALREQGVFTPLGSSNPPQSPTAWSSFATCKNPGAHGVYDFLRRDPKRYLPAVGFGSPEPPTLAPDGTVTKPPAFRSVRKGKSFWGVANEQGAKVKILTVPFAFPAEDLEDSCMLSGLGVPDLRGTQSTFFLMTDGPPSKTALAGGVELPLRFNGNVATVQLPALRHPQTRQFVEAPVTVTADRAAKSATVAIPGKTITLKEGEWSEWLEWSFAVTSKFEARAISRIQLLECGAQVRLYMTCLQFDPRNQYIRFTTPPGYGADLVKRYGLFTTIGWDHDTHALRQDALTEDLFLDDVKRLSAWRAALTLDELDRGNLDLLVSAWTGPDRVSHLFWRFRDPKHPLYTPEGAAKYGRAVEDTYIHMDRIVGDVAKKLGPDDLLMVMSDHGFHSFRMGFNVNTWLIRNGYLTVDGQADPKTAFNPKDFLQGYDWAKTRAYNLGLGSVFLNIKDREGKGTVAPAEATALIAEIRAKLLDVADPATGEKVFRAIYTRDEFHGEAAGDAPDIQLGYADGYQSTKDAAKGAAPEELFEPNDDKWSGEHAASDIASTPGILFVNRPIAIANPRLEDLGVTALAYLGKTVPTDFEGRNLLAPAP